MNQYLDDELKDECKVSLEDSWLTKNSNMIILLFLTIRTL